MARGYGKAASEQSPSLERRANQAIRNAPKSADYLDGLQPFDYPYDSKNKNDIQAAVFDYLNDFDIQRADRKRSSDSPALAAFKEQVASALDDAKSNGSELVTRGSINRGYEQDEVWSGEGESGIYKTVLKAPGAPGIEISWSVRAYNDYDEDNVNFNTEIKLKNVKIL